MAFGEIKEIKYLKLKDKIRFKSNSVEEITIQEAIHEDINHLNELIHRRKLYVAKDVIEYCLRFDYHLGDQLPQYMHSNPASKKAPLRQEGMSDG